jgi:hypothetical protein
MNANVHLIIPIDEVCFGGKPIEYGPNAIFTDFIFLRNGSTSPLEEELLNFIQEAKQAKEPVIVMAFSSMPVTRSKILQIAISMIN